MCCKIGTNSNPKLIFLHKPQEQKYNLSIIDSLICQDESLTNKVRQIIEVYRKSGLIALGDLEMLDDMCCTAYTKNEYADYIKRCEMAEEIGCVRIPSKGNRRQWYSFTENALIQLGTNKNTKLGRRKGNFDYFLQRQMSKIERGRTKLIPQEPILTYYQFVDKYKHNNH